MREPERRSPAAPGREHAHVQMWRVEREPERYIPLLYSGVYRRRRRRLWFGDAYVFSLVEHTMRKRVSMTVSCLLP